MDLTKAEDIKKRWQEYTEELYKKDVNDPDDHEGVRWTMVLGRRRYEATRDPSET